MISALSNCTLCPRRCGADRAHGETGFCGSGAKARVFRWGPHFGEEPPLTGERGSGAVFFSRCTMRCIYCQNSPWSWRGEGEDVEIPRLTGIFRELATESKCENWNLVSPAPWLPLIREAVKPLISADIRLPFVYNTSGFESAETLDAFPDLCDIALCDLRYSRNATAREASCADGYVEASRAAFKRFWNRLGPLETDSRGVPWRDMQDSRPARPRGRGGGEPCVARRERVERGARKRDVAVHASLHGKGKAAVGQDGRCGGIRRSDGGGGGFRIRKRLDAGF